MIITNSIFKYRLKHTLIFKLTIYLNVFRFNHLNGLVIILVNKEVMKEFFCIENESIK
jgi:hypothetical protein